MAIKLGTSATFPEVLDPNTVYVVYVDDERGLAASYPALIRAKLNNHEVVKEVAQRINIEVLSFDYPVDALEALQDKNLYRVVIVSDNNMPEMDGTELVSRLRTVDSEVPMALLSALAIDAKERLPANVKDVPVYSKPNSDFSAITDFIIPKVLAAAEKPAQPALPKASGPASKLES